MEVFHAVHSHHANTGRSYLNLQPTSGVGAICRLFVFRPDSGVISTTAGGRDLRRTCLPADGLLDRLS